MTSHGDAQSRYLTALRTQPNTADPSMRAPTHHTSEATAGGGSTPDITNLSLDAAKGRLSPSGKKRPADSEFDHRRGKAPLHTDVYDDNFRRDYPDAIVPERPLAKSKDASRFIAPTKTAKLHVASEWSVEANPSQVNLPTMSAPKVVRQPGSTAQSYEAKPAVSPAPTRINDLVANQRCDARYPGLLLQPDSRPISQEQLASEVKSIYAGLTMVETKCIHVDRAQTAALQNGSESAPKLASDHWQALIALHKTLLHEHHDFFLASQHPSASPALKRLAARYSMPARMWKHGIHSFLELLRCRLPESIDYMLAFIYLAYQMMALLYETVPAFEETWIECLGDLGRYRMAIEDDNPRDREIWAGVARSWYSKASDKNPEVGRLYHHLAILARPNALWQLYYYARSLACVKPFPSARESILTLLDPILSQPESRSFDVTIDTSFIQAHGVLFKKLSAERFEDARYAFHSQLDNHIARVGPKWKEQGVLVAVTNIAGLFDYGSDKSILRQILMVYGKQSGRSMSEPSQTDESSRSPSPTDLDTAEQWTAGTDVSSRVEALSSDFTFSRAYFLTMDTLTLLLKRVSDKNVLPHVHVLLSFLSCLAAIKDVAQFNDHAPWPELAFFLNALLKSERPEKKFPGAVFPTDQVDSLPLPEDYLIRGQIWSQWYFPETWFDREHDVEDRQMELPSTVKQRTERVLQLGCQLANLNRWISYDERTCTFSVMDDFDSS